MTYLLYILRTCPTSTQSPRHTLSCHGSCLFFTLGSRLSVNFSARFIDSCEIVYRLQSRWLLQRSTRRLHIPLSTCLSQLMQCLSLAVLSNLISPTRLSVRRCACHGEHHPLFTQTIPITDPPPRAHPSQRAFSRCTLGEKTTPVENRLHTATPSPAAWNFALPWGASKHSETDCIAWMGKAEERMGSVQGYGTRRY